MTTTEIILSITLLINTFFIYWLNSDGMTIKEKVLPKSIIIMILAWFLLCVNSFCNVPLKAVNSYIILMLMLVFAFPKNLKKRLLSYLLLMLYGLIVEYVIFVILNAFVLIDVFNMNLTNQTILTILCEIVWFGSWILLKKSKALKNILQKVVVFMEEFVGVETLSVLILGILNILLGQYYSNISTIPGIITIFLLIISVCFVLKAFIKNKKNEHLLIARNEFLQQNITAYEKTIENYRMFKHNVITDLMTINLTANKETQKAIIVKMKFYEKTYSWVNQISNIPNGIKGLITMKIQQAGERNVKCLIECNSKKKSFNNLGIKRFVEMCDILNILINNAIEAAQKCKNKYINIIIEDKPYLIIKIINPFKCDLDIKCLGSQGYSTKGGKRGIGLFFIKKYKSKKVKIDTKIINDLFISTVTLK